ncbi:phosphopyruvate hydratase [Lapillicoccus sp.]|uniref:phosphopyruvate hydratase n=1 Tax=Lapillicoccus sp. TaxID=1909287 RepID=UPI0032644B94
MTLHIETVRALEILDSRGRPTLAVRLTTGDGHTVDARVPSGASTGAGEAVELRDKDPQRYGGAGTSQAVANVEGPIADALNGRSFADLAEVDARLITADGTPNKASLGANAIIGVSMAAARGFADAAGTPLWTFLSPDGGRPALPVPHFNVVNGGAHAPNRLDFQEFMIAPLGAPSVAEAVRAGAEVYATLRHRLAAAGHATGLGDEGGFAPDLARPDEVLETLVSAIADAGYETGRRGVAIALDPAANGFYDGGHYTVVGDVLSSAEMVEYYADLVDRFPIWSLEDGLAEDDWEGWVALTRRLGEQVQLVGDDIFVTDPTIIRDAAGRGVANAALIKPNQIGTVTETLEALAVCREIGFAAMVSHRSGETEDTFIADLSVGSGCGQIKSGAPARGERVAKYNRLMEIAHDEPDLPFGSPER